jgi:cell division protein FtsW
MSFARTDRSLVAHWWWTVDRWTLLAIGALAGFGLILAFAASPAVAERIGVDSLHFVKRHFAMLPLALALMLFISMQSPRNVRRLALFCFVVFTALLAYTFIGGVEIKGARRWINIPGFSLQPSEFVKPTFAVLAAWLFAEKRAWLALLLFAVTVGLLVRQPDLGMAVVVCAVFLTQFFLAGLRLYWMALLGGGAVAGLVGAYSFLPHVKSRIDRFLDPSSGDSYQIDRSIEAFGNGGLWGTGPGEGRVKEWLPDAHSDFVFAVAGEELGLVLCLIIVAIFAFIVLRGLSRMVQEQNLWIVLASTGLFVQFGLQAVINMSSSLHLMPTKGMTLPFISYGGSSMIALALGMGMALALTRRRLGGDEA